MVVDDVRGSLENGKVLLKLVVGVLARVREGRREGGQVVNE